MGRVFLGIALSVLLMLLADEWKTNDLSVNRLLSSIQFHGPTVESHTHTN